MISYDPPSRSDGEVRGFKALLKESVIKAPSWVNRGSHRFLSWFQEQPVPWRAFGHDEPDYLSTLTNPRTLRYRQGVRGKVVHPGGEQGPWAPWQTELARFAVPYGSVGFVNSWEQFLDDYGSATPQIQFWGNPFVAGDDFRWILRLDTYNGRIPPWLDTLTPTPWPGIPFPDLPEERGLWFRADTARQPFRWVVPGGHCLRIFFEQTAISESVRFTVAAKVRGLIQSAYSDEARDNLRKVW